MAAGFCQWDPSWAGLEQAALGKLKIWTQREFSSADFSSYSVYLLDSLGLVLRIGHTGPWARCMLFGNLVRPFGGGGAQGVFKEAFSFSAVLPRRWSSWCHSLGSILVQFSLWASFSGLWARSGVRVVV